MTAVVLETRQRARVNGKIESISPDELIIAVQNSFFSCPKFIQGTPPVKSSKSAFTHSRLISLMVQLVHNAAEHLHSAFAARRLNLLSEELRRIGESRPVQKGGHELGPAERDLIERCCHDCHFLVTCLQILSCYCQTALCLQPLF